MLHAGGPDGNLKILTESRKELHQVPDREVTRTVPHQRGDLRLLRAEDFGDRDLCHTAQVFTQAA